MTLKLFIGAIMLLLLAHQLVDSRLPWAEAHVKCLSCGLISPEGTKALFTLNAQMEDSVKAGHVVDLGDPLKDKHLMDMMEDVVTMMDTQRCNDTEALKLISMLARLEEGEEWWEKDRVEYVKKRLVGTLENQFVKILNICIDEGRRMASLPEIRANLLDFVSFAEVVKSSIQFGSPGASAHKKSLKLIVPNDPQLTVAGNTLNQATRIMASDKGASLIKDIWGHYFKADVADGAQLCRLRLDENLIQKYEPLAKDLTAILKPMLVLMSYNPENFVKIPKEEMDAREIFDALSRSRRVWEQDKMSELRQLYKLLKLTLRKAEDYCPKDR